MANSMDYVGMACLMEKKECIIDGKNFVYYEQIDVVCGYFYYFNNTGKEFIILSGKYAGQEIDDKSRALMISDFETFNELCTDNNYKYDYSKFIDSYSKTMGCYYIYYPQKNSFARITDQEIINKIKSRDKKYDEKLLNNDSNISQMYSTIKKTIISQDEQIMQILTSLFKNQKVINSKLDHDMITKLKENIIVYGSTGTGKTEILKRIASIYNIPIVIEDATSLSETGYVGRNITDMLENLYLAANKDIEVAQKGILVIDEFDKLAEKKDGSRDHVSRIGVQRSLLKLLDGSVFYFGDKKFDTSKLSVVALGAFTDMVVGNDYSNVSSADFVNYGIMRELMGRFSKLVAMNPLSKEDIKKILIESNFSPLNTYKLLFQEMNIDFSYDNDFVDYIAEKAILLNSGARSLKTIFDDTISEAMFRIFADDYVSINLVKPINEQSAYVLTKRKKK